MSDDNFLTLSDVTLAYGKEIAVEKLSLNVPKGKLIALLGPSGCGKSTTMRAIAGLLPMKHGTIELDGIDISKVGANKRQVGLVFQSYALFPHLSVFENVAFGLRLKKLSAEDVKTRVEAGLETVQLIEFADRLPGELSGGQQQRVALVRSLVMDPKVLLLDEPLSNLDARLRLEMRNELQRVQRESGLTMVFVTHDQGEALALADTIVVMNKGRIEQIGTPEEIYNEPQSGFVADFVGFENIFAVNEGKISVETGSVELSGTMPVNAAGLAWRPNKIIVGEGPFEGEIVGVSFTGDNREYVLGTDLGEIKVEVAASRNVYPMGGKIAFDLPMDGAAILQRL